MKILDLYCGLGGWAKGLMDTGHDVIGYDIMDFSKEYPGRLVQTDLLKCYSFPDADVIVASPPCTEFSKASFPKTWKSVMNNPPDIKTALKLFNRVYEIIEIVKPKYYAIENVRGAQKFIGRADYHFGSRYIWTNLKNLKIDGNDLYGKWKMPPSKNRAILRSIIPYSISRGIGIKLKEVEK